MRVKDIMTRDPQFCRVDNNLAEVAELLWNNNCGVLPVVDELGKPIGMVTDRDICIAVGTRNLRPSETKVGQVAVSRLFATTPEHDVHAALATMKAEKVRRLAVLNEGALEGILSLNDIALHATKRQGDLSYTDVAETLKAICEHTVPESLIVVAA